jgi:hypothetical protein
MKPLLALALLACPMFGGWTSDVVYQINTSKVPSSQSNYPAMFCGNAASGVCSLIVTNYAKTVVNGGSVTRSDGFDLVISSGNCNSAYSLIAFDRREWSGTSGFMLFIFKSQPSSSTPYPFHVCAGNAAITTDQSNPTAVYDTSIYGLVYPLARNGSLSWLNATSYTDASSNPMTLTAHGTPTLVAGQFGNAAAFASSAYATDTVAMTFLPGGATPRTLSAWFKVSVGGQIISYGNNAFAGAAFTVNYNSSYGMLIQNAAGGSVFAYTPGSTWHLLHAVVPSGSTDLTTAILYVDGVQLTKISTLNSNYTLATTSSFPTIAAWSDGTEPFAGSVQEGRFILIGLSANWITMEYNNESSPSTFFTAGTVVVNNNMMPVVY